MNLIEESFQREKKQKTKKTTKIIMAILIILLIAIIGIIIAIYYLDKTTLKIYLNGQQDAKLKELLVFEEDGNIYVPIRAISSYLGYQSYNGDYSNKSEEINKCYIQSEDEITNFYLNSNKIYKMNLEESDDYEYFYIDKPVKSINGNLYTTIDGIQKAFNVSFVYNKEENNIVIYTLPYLVEYYSKQVLDLGYNKLSDVFNNEKAILENMLIVESANNDLGVINANTGETIIETKYDDIYYLQHTGDFLVEDNSKVGIISKNRETKVQLSYDSIELMDSDAGLYLVKRDNKYGVMKITGEVVIEPIYDNLKQTSLGTFIAKKGENYGIINWNNEEKLEFNYIGITYSEKADIYIAEKEDNTADFLNYNLEKKLQGIFLNIDVEKGYLKVRVGDDIRYYNFRFEEKKDTEILTSNTLFLRKKDGKYGLVDKNENIVVDYQYDDAVEQNIFGYVAVKKDGKWGSIDSKGNVVCEPTYNLDSYFYIDFIGRWHLGQDLNMNYYNMQ